MIENKDLFEPNLFDDTLKDLVKLASATEDLEKSLKDLATQVGKIDMKDSFKSYDGLKQTEANIEKLDTALKGLNHTEAIRKDLVKESTQLSKLYEAELLDLTQQNKELETSSQRLISTSRQESAEFKKLEEQMAKNRSRVTQLVNSTRIIEAIQAKNTKATLESITAYRKLEERSRALIALNSKYNQTLKETQASQANVGGASGEADATKRETSALERKLAILGQLLPRMRAYFNIQGRNLRITLENTRGVKLLVEQLRKLKDVGANALKGLTIGLGFGVGTKLIDGVTGALAEAQGVASSFTVVLQKTLSAVFDGFTKLFGLVDTYLEKFFPGGTPGPGITGKTKEEVDELNEALKDLEGNYNVLSGKNFPLDLNLLTKLDTRALEDIFLKLDSLGVEARKIAFGAIAPDAFTKVLAPEIAKVKAEIASLEAGVASGAPGYKELLVDAQSYLGVLNEINSSTLKELKKFGDAKDFIADYLKILKDRGITKPITTPRSGTSFTPPSFITETTEEIKELLRQQAVVDALAVSVGKLSAKYENLSDQLGDSTKPLSELLSLTDKARTASNELASAEANLASQQVKLAQKAVKVKTGTDGFTVATLTADSEAFAKVSRADVENLISAELAVTEAAQAQVARQRQITTERRQVLSDQFEQELDALIDNADKLKSIRENIANDESKSLTERQTNLQEAKFITQTSYDDQIKLLKKFQVESAIAGLEIGDRKKAEAILPELSAIDDITAFTAKLASLGITLKDYTDGVKVSGSVVEDLVNTTDISDFNKKVKDLELSEIITNRILEIVRERQQNIKDLGDAGAGITLSDLQLQFNTEDIQRQKDYLDFLTKQNQQLQILNTIGALSKGSTSGQIKDQIVDIDKELQKRQDEELEILIKQSEDKLIIAKELGQDTADIEAELFRLRLEQQKVFLDRQRKANEEALQSQSSSQTAFVDAEKKRLEKNLETANSAFALLSALSEKYANDRLRRIDNEISSVADREAYLLALAEKGSEKLNENLAFEQKKAAELELQREKIEQGRARRALAISLLETYNANLNAAQQQNLLVPGSISSPGNYALAKTAADVALLQALVNSLPAFYEGVDDTGRGGSLDDKDGFLAVLHPHERVMTAEQNKYLSGMSNEDIVRKVNRSQDLQVQPLRTLELKMEELIQVTKSKETYLGGDYNEISKTFVEKIKAEGKLVRRHTRADNIF